MAHLINIGDRFGRWTVISQIDKIRFTQNNRTVYRYFLKCECDCGETVNVCMANLIRGKSMSCGCLKRELASERLKKHGGANNILWHRWKGMMHRCYNKNDIGYACYGGRGISVCDSWRESPINFYEDMGPPPTPKHTIERIDVNDDYTKENCKWATWGEQSLNKRNTVYVYFRGEKVKLKDITKKLGLPYRIIYNRIFLKKTFTVERALTEPVVSMNERIKLARARFDDKYK